LPTGRQQIERQSVSDSPNSAALLAIDLDVERRVIEGLLNAQINDPGMPCILASKALA